MENSNKKVNVGDIYLTNIKKYYKVLSIDNGYAVVCSIYSNYPKTRIPVFDFFNILYKRRILTSIELIIRGIDANT